MNKNESQLWAKVNQWKSLREFHGATRHLWEKHHFHFALHICLRRTKFSNRGWRHRQSWFFAKCFSFRDNFNNVERRKLSESFCACFFVLDLKYVITNVSRKVFFQHDMRAGTSTNLFQNNKICTTPRSKICSGDVHVLDLFPIFTPLLKYCAS